MSGLVARRPKSDGWRFRHPNLLRLVDVLNFIPDDIEPNVLAMFIDRIIGLRKFTVRKGPYRDGNQVGVWPSLIICIRPAKGTKMKNGNIPAVSNAFPNPLFARYFDIIRIEPRLNCECRTRALLAVIAMTN